MLRPEPKVQQGKRREERHVGNPGDLGYRFFTYDAKKGCANQASGRHDSLGKLGTFPIHARKEYWCTKLQAEVEDMSCANVCTVCPLVYASIEDAWMTRNDSCLFQGGTCAPNGGRFSNGAQFLASILSAFLFCRNYGIFLLCACLLPGI